MGKKYTVRCRELDSEGRGIVEFNNSTFSVPYLLPGEKAEISLVYGKNKTGAKLESVLTPSPERTEPLCPMYRRCGGCTLMHLNYEGQLRWKQSVVERAVAGIASPKAQKKAALDPPKILPILGMEGEPLYYRNKIHSTFAKNARNDTVIGLYEEATHHVVPVKLCAIEQPVAARIRKTVLRFAREQNIPIYNEDTGRGVLRHLMFRVAKNGGVMVVIVVGQGIFREKSLLADAIVKQHPEVRTVVLNYNPKKDDDGAWKPGGNAVRKRLSGGRCRQLHVPAFPTLVLSGQRAPDGAPVPGRRGACRPSAVRDRSGRLLRHRHHHAPARQVPAQGGDRRSRAEPGGGGGRRQQREAQPLAERDLYLRRRRGLPQGHGFAWLQAVGARS